MKELNARHKARWHSARVFFERMINTAKRHNAVLMFDGTVIELHQLKVVDDTIFVEIGTSRWILFQADPDFDHGLYDKTAEYEREMRKRFAVVKKLDW